MTATVIHAMTNAKTVPAGYAVTLCLPDTHIASHARTNQQLVLSSKKIVTQIVIASFVAQKSQHVLDIADLVLIRQSGNRTSQC
jgi:hypothetical protein